MKVFSGFTEDKKTRSIILILCGLLFLYVSIRSYRLAITWDEAYCYLEFIRKEIFSPFYYSGISANNHLLNTWLCYLSTSLLGVSEFTLRIPNTLAYLLFLFFTAKFSNEFSTSLLKISSFLILNLNPYLIDFFSLSRGYGLSYGLMAGGLWYLYLFLKNNFQNKHSLRSISFAMTAVFAYLSWIHFAIVLFMGIFFIDFLFSHKELGFLKRFLFVLEKNFVAVILFLIFLLIIIPRIFGLKNADALFYGGTTGFWKDTMLTIFERSLYEQHYPGYLKYLLSYFAILVMLTAIFISITRIYSKNIHHEKLFPAVLVFLLVYCSLVTVLLHHFALTPYLTNRTALFLLILFSFLFVFLLNELAEKNKIFKWVLPVISFFVLVHFFNSFNLKYVLEYNLNADMKEMVSDIDSLKNEIPPEKFSMDVGVSYDFLPPFNYYRNINKLSWLNVADKFNKLDPSNDFCLFTEKELKKIHTDSFVVIKTYPLFNSVLMKRKYMPGRDTICYSLKQNFETSSASSELTHALSGEFFFSGKTSGLTNNENEYSDGIIYNIDLPKTPGRNSRVMVKAMVLMQKLNNSAGMVVSFENNKHIYYWHETPVADFALKAEEWYPVYFSCRVPGEVQQNDKLAIYLWNKDSPVYVDDMEMRWINGVY